MREIGLWLADIFRVIFRYTEYRKTEEWAARELARLKLIAGLRFYVDVFPSPTRPGQFLLLLDGEDKTHRVFEMTAEDAYLCAKYGGYAPRLGFKEDIVIGDHHIVRFGVKPA